MSPHGYEEKEHRADLALRVWGEDFFSLLHQAAEGMMALMGTRFDANQDKEKTFTIPPGSREEKLVDFLGEVLFMLEEQDLALSSFKVACDEPLTIAGNFHPLISVERWIKAVTFHNLVFVEHPDRIETTITFDV